MNFYAWIIVGSLVAAWALENLAAFLSLRSLAKASHEAVAVLGPDNLERALSYGAANARLGLVESAWTLALVLAAMFWGGFNAADRIAGSLAATLGLGTTLGGVIFVGVIGLAASLAHMPLSLYATFVKEERFGFNRTTLRTWIKDRFKSLILALVLGGPLVWAVLVFFAFLGPWAWLAAWGTVVLFLAFVHVLGPVLILPLFNTFTPLDPGPVRDLLLTAARKAGIQAADVLVMDGSRRSTKANAFFTGLGSKRRIVLLDTLLEQHESEEAAAVLAHEAGHWKLGHVPLMFLMAALKAGLMLWLLSLFITAPGLHQVFHMERVTLHGGLVFFLVLMTPLGMALGVLTGFLSRRMERAADRFAMGIMGSGQALAKALSRLGRDNLANPEPHALAVILGHSHPPLAARIRSLRESRTD